MKEILKYSIKVLIPIVLGSIVLLWTYRDFDFSVLDGDFLRNTDWMWLILSLPFGVISPLLRGLRWRLVLSPMGMDARRSVLVNSVFVGYAANLIVPRVGEISRCGILRTYDCVPASASLGTLVTERVVDMACVLLITLVAVLGQSSRILEFLRITGTDMNSVAKGLHVGDMLMLAIIALAICSLGAYMAIRMGLLSRIRRMCRDMISGVLSILRLEDRWTYILMTAGIWVCYILHFHLALYAFDATSHVGIMASLVLFTVGTFAVVVPTPNGAGPWHFAVITMLMVYGVGQADAGLFALVVHAVQTLVIVLMGVWGLFGLAYTEKKNKNLIL